MWNLMSQTLGTNSQMRCNALAAVVREVEETCTDVQKHVMFRLFFRAKSSDVVPVATAILQTAFQDTCLASLQDLRAAILCMQAWQKYSDRVKITSILVQAIRLANLADDIAETLDEIIGYTGADINLLIAACDGLIASFQSVQGSDDEATVHHAIAEVACMVADGNADELMEQEDLPANTVTQKATHLLWLCLQSSDERAFLAAVEGWSSWIGATNLIERGRGCVAQHQVSSVVSTVVQRMKCLQFVADVIGETEESSSESICVRDFLLEATASLGTVEYIKVIVSLLDAPWNSSTQAFCAALMAFAIAGEEVDCAGLSLEGREVLFGMLRRVMDVAEGAVGDGTVALKRAALSALGAHAATVAQFASEEELSRAMRCVRAGILDGNVSVHAAEFLFRFAEARAERLGPFLQELLQMGTDAMLRMPGRAAEFYIRGLGKIVGMLKGFERRFSAMEVVLGPASRRVLWTREERDGVDKEGLGQALGLVSVGLQEVNDNSVALAVFGRLRSVVFEVALEHCGDGIVSKNVCKLLEVAVLPTLIDDGCEEGGGTDAARVGLAMACMTLAAECFRRSGRFGESCWLGAVGKIAPHVLECLEGSFDSETEGMAFSCLTMALGHALDGLRDFSGTIFDSRAGMATKYFRFAGTLLSRSVRRSPVCPHATECARAGLLGLQCEDLRLVREALVWWKAVFRPMVGSETTRLVLTGGGGADAVATRLVFAARHWRCAGGVCDALFALAKWVAKDVGGEAGEVLRACLGKAFRDVEVVARGLDGSVREMVFRRCMEAVRSQQEMRSALREFGRICGRLEDGGGVMGFRREGLVR